MSPPKKIVLDELLAVNLNVGDVSVTRGRGTGHRWVTIRTDVEIPKNVKDEIIKKFEDEQLIGHYYDDYGGGGYPTVSWNVFRPF